MADELLRGRQRRYFGYMQNIAHKIDTPESAKSFRSVISPLTRKVKWKYEPVKTFKPDPPGQTRFVDKILHRALQTQIPGLMPALKNSPQYEEHDESLKINLRSPQFEQRKERSLHYFWLPRNERSELCGIIQSHLKPSEKRKNAKRFVPGGKAKTLQGMAAEAAILDQQEYLDKIANDPRFIHNKARLRHHGRRVSDVSDRLYRMNRRFQTSYWDPTFNKNLTDPFRRIRGRFPACDAVCHEFFPPSQEYRDLLTCVDEYQRRYEETHNLAGEDIELSDKRDQLRRFSLFGTLDDEKRKRNFKHIKQLKEYDMESEALWKKQAKLIVSAAEYINKIKMGRRFPTPPREAKKRERKSKKTDASNSDSDASTARIEEYLNKEDAQQNSNKQKLRKRRHFHHNYNSEDFYMEMYLHFLNPDEDVSLKPPPKELTDVKELRRKMNLDEDPEMDRNLIELLNESSVEALHVHTGGHSRKTEAQTHSHSLEDAEQEKAIIEKQLARLKNPRLTHILTRMISRVSLTEDTVSSTVSKKTSSGDDDRVSAVAEQLTSLPTERSSTTSGKIKTDADDEDLDTMGDIPDHELRLIMSEIAASSKQSETPDNLSSGSSAGEEDENEGEGEEADDDALKLFKKARKKKDSLAELMDLSAEFRSRVCPGEVLRGPLNPFQEAACVLYPKGSEKKDRKSKAKEGTRASTSEGKNEKSNSI